MRGPNTAAPAGLPPRSGDRTSAPGRPVGPPGPHSPVGRNPSANTDNPTEKRSETNDYGQSGQKLFVPPRRPEPSNDSVRGGQQAARAESATQAYSAVKEPSNRQTIGSRVEDQEEPVAPPRTAGSTSSPTMNRTAIWAFVLSLLGITSPVGIYLGYKSRDEIEKTRQYGAPFATVAIRLGWAWIAVAVVAVLVYLFIFVF